MCLRLRFANPVLRDYRQQFKASVLAIIINIYMFRLFFGNETIIKSIIRKSPNKLCHRAYKCRVVACHLLIQNNSSHYCLVKWKRRNDNAKKHLFAVCCGFFNIYARQQPRRADTKLYSAKVNWNKTVAAAAAAAAPSHTRIRCLLVMWAIQRIWSLRNANIFYN